MKKIIFTLYILYSFALNSQGYNVIFWDDLKPKVDFKDPFKEMDLFQLQSLGKLAGLRTKAQKEGEVLSELEIKEKKALETALKAANIDYEYLFSNREEIIKKRKEAIEGLNTKLNNTTIEISGYLLPLNLNQGKSNEFLLVPWVGACIHTPPPPKNQIIHVKTKDWAVAPGLFDAVILKGKITITEKASSLFLEDGTSIIITGYSVENAKVEKF